MTSNLLYIALTTGLLSSLHCIGMCGPIALALPVGGFSKSKALYFRLLYNFGRISSYVFLGIVFGFVGKQLSLLLIQRQVSIIAGIALLVIIFAKNLKYMHLQKIYLYVKTKVFSNIHLKTEFGIFSLGLVNGFLPCGVLYLALVGSVATGSTIGGATFMLLFGLGTAPALLLAGNITNYFPINIRQKINHILPIYSVFLAIFLIFRGFNFQLPSFLHQNKPASSIGICHGK